MVIILTAYGNMDAAIKALRLDADEFLLKPCNPDEMILRVERCLEKLELKRKVKIYENIIPVCCVCKKIRDDLGRDHGAGQWMNVENYMWKRASLLPSSTYCPDCLKSAEEEF